MKKSIQSKVKSQKNGFALLEIVVATTLVGAIAITAGTLVAAQNTHSEGILRLRATLLAESILEAAGSVSPKKLILRANGAPQGALFRIGDFAGQTVSGAPSSPRALATTATSTAVAGNTSLLPFPLDDLDRVELTVSGRVPVGSPVGWSLGFLVRATDAENGYRFSQNAATLLFEKIVSGTATTLWSKSLSATPGTWYQYRLEANGSQFTLYRGGISEGTVSDATYASGALALASGGNALPAYDSITIISGSKNWYWDFDGYPVATLPAPWFRLGAADLPGGAADLSVSDVATSSTLKSLSARVRYRSTRGQKTVTLTSNR